MAARPKGPDGDARAARPEDRQALEVALRRLLPRVRNLVRYLVQNDEDIDDMAQVALIQIARAIHTFRGDGSLESWADRITVRETLRYKKRRVRHRSRLKDAAPSLRDTAPVDTPETYVERRETIALLDSLPEAQREVVVLHHIVGHSLREVAQTLNVPHETARSRLRLGVQRLRDAIRARIGRADR